MNIFKRPYTVRRYGKVDWNDENLTEEYSDMQLMLDVQAKTRTNEDAMGGQGVQAKLTVYSDVELFPAERVSSRAVTGCSIWGTGMSANPQFTGAIPC